MLRNKLPKNWRIEKDAATKNAVTRQKLKEYCMQQDQDRNLEQWVYYVVNFGIYKTDWNLLKIRKSSKILTHWAVLAVPECSEIHGRICVFPETFWIVNLPVECLKNHTMIQEIWHHHHRGLREEKELRKVGVKNHCNQCLYFAFSKKLRKKVWTTEIVLSLWLTMPRVSGHVLKGGMINPSHLSSEMHLGKFSDNTEFQRWIVNFRTEVRSKAKNPTRALQWIKEIEAAKSLDDLITPKSITGKDFPDTEELDLMMASALKRCYDKQTHFRKKISVEEQRAQKDNRFLRGRQIICLIFEYFRPTGSYDEIQGLSGLFSILENDDIQDFDLRWEQALLLTSDPPSDNVLESLYVSKLQDSSHAQTIMALYNQEILRRG